MSTCAHNECTQGAALAAACDSCAQDICASDPYCCQTAWDSICVGETTSICGETCP